MNLHKNGLQKRIFRRKVLRQARRANSKELRKALWDVRKELTNNQSAEEGANWKLYLREQAISNELKRRELLEWALKTGPEPSTKND
ncbi:MAG: hypothetical protein K9W42_13070 [Candidatus Heimdallarchaeota archaeon]|nr:hypothetical protein [Candidatus Heimdallarchaeota archaeon]